ncbi:MAG: hypothetical protein OEY14_14325 [Myxococcales bacterium]|nr:hypothetical protein [Myxococcales bacterium]
MIGGAIPLRRHSGGVQATEVLRVLRQIHQLGENATGALMLGRAGRAEGSVLVENGRLCWAVAAGMRRRMSDLIREEAGDAAEPGWLEAHYRRCREQNRPFGEALVEEGLVSAAGLRKALSRHTSESIAKICSQAELRMEWMPHRNRRYDARFTFEPWRVLVAVGSLVFPEESAKAEQDLKRIVPSRGFALAFVREPGISRPFPVAVAGQLPSEEADPLAVGGWATSILDLVRAVDPDGRIVAASTPAGPSLVAWGCARTVTVAICMDTVTMARLLGRESRSCVG